MVIRFQDKNIKNKRYELFIVSWKKNFWEEFFTTLIGQTNASAVLIVELIASRLNASGIF